MVDLFIRTASLNSSSIDCRMGLKYNVKDRISELTMDSLNNGFGWLPQPLPVCNQFKFNSISNDILVHD